MKVCRGGGVWVLDGQGPVTSPEPGRISVWDGKEPSCVRNPGLSVALLPQTKDVTRAMDERRFDEALKLRGR